MTTTEQSTTTPGPWRFDAEPKGALSGWILPFGAVDDDPWEDPWVAHVDVVRSVDLRLILAAPDLLAALVALAEYVEDDNPGAVLADAWVSKLHDDARAAIARARGTL